MAWWAANISVAGENIGFGCEGLENYFFTEGWLSSAIVTGLVFYMTE